MSSKLSVQRSESTSRVADCCEPKACPRVPKGGMGIKSINKRLMKHQPNTSYASRRKLIAIPKATAKKEVRKEGKGRERKGKEGKGRERKGKEGKGREREGKEGQGRERKGKEGKGRERKGKEGKGRNPPRCRKFPCSSVQSLKNNTIFRERGQHSLA